MEVYYIIPMKNNRKITRGRKTTHQYSPDIFVVLRRGRKEIHRESYDHGLSGAAIKSTIDKLESTYTGCTIVHYPRTLIRHDG